MGLICEIKKVKAANMFWLISEILERGQKTKLLVSGESMNPFLRDGIDSVEFTKGCFEQLSRGDIVVIKRSDGSYVMHRICRKEIDCFFMVADAQQWIEGPLYPDQLVAVVTAIWREDKCISCSIRWWRWLSELWLLLRPIRCLILRVDKKLPKQQKIHKIKKLQR